MSPQGRSGTREVVNGTVTRDTTWVIWAVSTVSLTAQGPYGQPIGTLTVPNHR